MIDKPALGNAYERMKEYEDRNRQENLASQMGPEFRNAINAIINSTTKNYKAVPIQKLAEWNAMLGDTNPNVACVDVKGVERVMRMNDRAVNVVQQYNEIKNSQYPVIDVIQNMYYEVPKDQRKTFLQSFPQLSDYWEWNRNYKNKHVKVSKWLDDRSAAYNEDAYHNSYAKMSQRTQKELEYAKAAGKDLSDFTNWELSRLYVMYANPNFMSYKDYVRDYRIGSKKSAGQKWPADYIS